MALSDEIQKLQELHQQGAITDEEFQQAKQHLLNTSAEPPRHSASPASVPSVASPATDAQTRQWAMFLHLSTLLGFVVPFLGLVAPILIWQLKKEEMPALDAHGKSVANWLISSFLYALGCVVLSFVLIGIPLLVVLGLLCIVFPIIGGIKANDGELWHYPMTIKFLK